MNKLLYFSLSLTVISVGLLSMQQHEGLVTQFSIADYIARHGMPAIEIKNGMRTIDLSGKGLTTLDGIEQLPGLNFLQVLLLNNNNITGLTPGIFQDLISLERLSLDHNKLNSLPIGVFRELKNLKLLGLSENQLTSLAPETFQGLTALRELSLYMNKLSVLASGAFQGLPNLISLHLFKNQLSLLDPGVFDGLIALQTLTINRNAIPGTKEEFRQTHGLGNNVAIAWIPQYARSA